MSKLHFLKFLVATLPILLALPVSAAGGPILHRQQTIPTRTATPAPTSDSQPTSPPPAADPTATTAPVSSPQQATAIATPFVAVSPTAAPCQEPPTLHVQNLVNVRFGPGVDYEIIAILLYPEVRPIAGRAAFAEWWLVELAGGRRGWVAGFATVTVSGYTGNLPIVPPPAINGQAPTPGPAWNPTPDPMCPPAAAPVLAATSAITGPATITVETAAIAVHSPDTATTVGTAAAGAGVATTATPTPPASPTRQPPAVAAAQSPGPSPSTWLILAGFTLLLIAAITWTIRATFLATQFPHSSQIGDV